MWNFVLFVFILGFNLYFEIFLDFFSVIFMAHLLYLEKIFTYYVQSLY